MCSSQHRRGRGGHRPPRLCPPPPSPAFPSCSGLSSAFTTGPVCWSWPCAPGAAGERRQLTPRKTCEGSRRWRGDRLDAGGDLSVPSRPGACDPNSRHLEMAKGDRGGCPNPHVRCCCGEPDPPVGSPALLKVLLKGPLGVGFLVGEAVCPALPESYLRAFALDSSTALPTLASQHTPTPITPTHLSDWITSLWEHTTLLGELRPWASISSSLKWRW